MFVHLVTKKNSWQVILSLQKKLIDVIFSNYTVYALLNLIIMSNQGCNADIGLSELEQKIICDQIERRNKYREQFLKLRTDPCLNSKESGYVFDPAIQNFLSMKTTQLEYFNINFRTIRFPILTIILPMCTLGYALWHTRTAREKDYRCGKIKYRDRLFKLA